MRSVLLLLRAHPGHGFCVRIVYVSTPTVTPLAYQHKQYYAPVDVKKQAATTILPLALCKTYNMCLTRAVQNMRMKQLTRELFFLGT